MKKTFLSSATIVGLMAVSACRSDGFDSAYARKLAYWRGRTAERLIERFGQPDRLFPINAETTAFVYIREGTLSALETSYPKKLEAYVLEGGSHKIYYCQTTFSILNGVVVDYAFNGDLCV